MELELLCHGIAGKEGRVGSAATKGFFLFFVWNMGKGGVPIPKSFSGENVSLSLSALGSVLSTRSQQKLDEIAGDDASSFPRGRRRA